MKFYSNLTCLFVLILLVGNQLIAQTVNENDFPDTQVMASGNATDSQTFEFDIDDNSSVTGDADNELQVTLTAVANATSVGDCTADGDYQIGGALGSVGALTTSSDFAGTTSDDCLCTGGYVKVEIDLINGFQSLAGGFNFDWTSINGSSEAYEWGFGYVEGMQADGTPITVSFTESDILSFCNAEYVSPMTMTEHLGINATPGVFAIDARNTSFGSENGTDDDGNAGIDYVNGSNVCDGFNNNQFGEDTPSDMGSADPMQAEGPNSSSDVTTLGLGLNDTDIITRVVFYYGLSNAPGSDCPEDGVIGDTGVGSNPSGGWGGMTFAPVPPACGACAGDGGIYITELSFNPSSAQGNDGDCEFIEIFNAYDNDITFDASNTTLSLSGGTSVAASNFDGITIASGEYVILTGPNFSGCNWTNAVPAGTQILDVGIPGTLNNGGETVTVNVSCSFDASVNFTQDFNYVPADGGPADGSGSSVYFNINDGTVDVGTPTLGTGDCTGCASSFECECTPPTFSATLECTDGSTEADQDEYYVVLSALDASITYDVLISGATAGSGTAASNGSAVGTAVTGLTGAATYTFGPITHSGTGSQVITIQVTDQANNTCPITAELTEVLCGYNVIADMDQMQDDLHAAGYFCDNPNTTGTTVADADLPGILAQATPLLVMNGSTVTNQYVYVLYEDTNADDALDMDDMVVAVNQTGLFTGLDDGATYFVEAISTILADVAAYTTLTPANTKDDVDNLSTCAMTCGNMAYTLQCCDAEAGDITNDPVAACQGDASLSFTLATGPDASSNAVQADTDYSYAYVQVDNSGDIVAAQASADWDFTSETVTTCTEYTIYGLNYKTADLSRLPGMPAAITDLAGQTLADLEAAISLTPSTTEACAELTDADFTVEICPLATADVVEGTANPDADGDNDPHTETICSGGTPEATLDILTGDNALVTAVNYGAVTTSGTMVAVNDAIADNAAIETNALTNATDASIDVTYTICPYTFGPDANDDEANMTDSGDGVDDCVASTVENDPVTAGSTENCVTYTVTVLPTPEAAVTAATGTDADNDSDGDPYTESICSGATPTGANDIVVGAGSVVTAVNYGAVTTSGTAVMANDTRADGDAIESNELTNATTSPIDVTYTICPYNEGPNGMDDTYGSDDCLATVSDNPDGTGAATTTDGMASCYTYTVTVNPLPTVTPDPNVMVCEAGMVAVNANATAGTAPLTIAWSDAGTGTASGYTLTNTDMDMLMIDASAASAGTIDLDVMVTDANGCTASSSTTVSVNDLVMPSPTAETMCVDAIQNIDATVTGGSSTLTYAWTITDDGGTGATDAANLTNADMAVVTFNSAGLTQTGTVTLEVTVTDTGVTPNCTATNTVQFLVNVPNCGTFPWDGNE